MPTGLHIHERTPLEDGPGEGRLVVMVHGAMDRSTSFNRVASRLPDWTVLSYDRRGYGRSHHQGPTEAFDDQVADLVGVLDGRSAIAFGHSFGGDVVLSTIYRRPGLITSALVWEAPQPWTDFWPAESVSRGAASELTPEERAEWFMRRMVGDRIWERLPHATREARRSEGRTFDAELRSLRAGAPFDPAEIRVAVLVGRGGKSRVHHRRGSRELASLLPKGELVEIAEADHGAHLTHPGEVADLIKRAAALATGR